MLTLLKQVAFAYLSCNGDAHAKTFYIRQVGQGEWRVTPADLPFEEGRLIELHRSVEYRRGRLVEGG